MILRSRLLTAVVAAVLAAGLGGQALADTNHTAAGTRPAHCSNNAVSNTTPGSGTNAATLGITTSVNSNHPNMSAPPVSNNTPENTNAANISSNNPGAHATKQNGNWCGSYNKTGKSHHHHSQSTTGQS